MSRNKILFFDDDNELVLLIKKYYDKLNFDMVTSEEEFKEKIKDKIYDVSLVNPNMYDKEISTLVRLLTSKKIPCVVILDKYYDIEKIIDALSVGAIDYFMRPFIGRLSSAEKEKVTMNIFDKIVVAINSKESLSEVDSVEHKKSDFTFDFRSATNKIIVIGSSTGGPQSLEKIIPLIPGEIPSPVIVIQHMPEVFTKKFAERLDTVCELRVKEAENSEELLNGVCYVAKGDYHLVLKKDSKGKIIINLNKKEKVLGVRPSINMTMESAATHYGKNTIGIILTGMGADGTIGSKKIKESGGTIIVQSEETSVLYGMPKSVFEKGYYDEVVDLQKIPVAILQILEV
ncbi:chemotaxis response regulator protein-glutamate methylesterase [Candidatus Woesearchaeota archaeon]|nr:chemotaxis response regulator protein-glutamate methylesterase [Candidatus Woesearchaeota archaeon]